MVSNVFRSVVQKNAFCDAGMPVATTSYTVLGEPTSCSVSLFGWTKANIVVMALVHLCRWCLCARGKVAEQKHIKLHIPVIWQQ